VGKGGWGSSNSARRRARPAAVTRTGRSGGNSPAGEAEPPLNRRRLIVQTAVHSRRAEKSGAPNGSASMRLRQKEVQALPTGQLPDRNCFPPRARFACTGEPWPIPLARTCDRGQAHPRGRPRVSVVRGIPAGPRLRRTTPPPGKQPRGFWEFPGGKSEFPGSPLSMALRPKARPKEIGRIVVDKAQP